MCTDSLWDTGEQDVTFRNADRSCGCLFCVCILPQTEFFFPSLELNVNTFGRDLELAALGDLDLLAGLVAGALGAVLDLLDDVVALEDLAEDDVAAVEPAGGVELARWPVIKLIGARYGGLTQ